MRQGSAGRARAPGVGLPTGTVTFLFTDIEGSTQLWETVPEAMEVALERHNRLLAEVIGGHGGVVVTSRGEGDAAAIIMGVAETQVAEPLLFAQLIRSSPTVSLGDERARELRAHGAHMTWDEALAYTLTQATASR